MDVDQEASGEDQDDQTMTTVEEDFFSALVGHGPLTTLVHDRIYPAIIPQRGKLNQSSFPAITYHMLSKQPVFALDGKCGLENTRIRLDVFAVSYLDVKRISLEARRAVNLNLVVGDETPRDRPDDVLEDGEPIYHESTDFSLWKQEAN